MEPIEYSWMSELRENILNFSIDYLEVYWVFNGIGELVKGLDSDNSNLSHFKEFGVMFDDNIKNYEYKLTFFKDNVPCFWVYRWKMINEHIETKDYICMYWSAFRILWEKYILDFIDENLKIERVKRFDLCLDLTLPITEILSHFKEIKQTWSKFYGVWWNIETVYIWQKKRKNKQSIIRIYNKIADIYAKEKQNLMAEYLRYNDVTRIEIEFREEISCNLPFKVLYDRKYLIDIFYSYIEKHTSIFKEIEYDKIILKRLQKNFDPESVSSSRMIKNKYAKMFVSYWRKILLSSCPVDMLLRHDLISDTTLKDIVISTKNWKLDLDFYRLWATIRNWKMVFSWPWGDNNEDIPF